MCNLCETNPVYEFTNKRKLCKRCFLNYFHRKILYTVRKFDMIKGGDRIFYNKKNDFRGVVLKEMLEFIADKTGIILYSSEKKSNKLAADSSIDSESEKIIETLIKGNSKDLKKYLPVSGRIIKPLYLFLDDEILLYARLRNLKFKKERKKEDKIKTFENELEKKHPEIKRAIVNSLLELYK